MSKTNVNTVKSQKDTAQSKRELFLMKVRKSFWVGIAILIILLILSIVVLSVIILDYARADERSVLLKSNMDAELDIFSIYYENETGEITVMGANGEKVIAPGTDVEYTIRVRNTDKIAIDYELDPIVEYLSELKIPLLVRVLDPDDNYILGSAKAWVPIDELNGFVYHHTLRRGQAVEYTFQWKWPFEQGNDEYDTFLGSNDDSGLKVTFSIFAVANLDIDANGGFIESGLAKTVALLIVAILLLIAIILFVVSIIKRKKEEQTPPPPPPAPEPKAPEVIVAPTPAPAPIPEPQREGFNGKMAYVNLDVLDGNFEAGEVITLTALKKRGLISEKTKQMKVLARNGYKLEKALIIETQGISTEARRIVVEAGGMVFITKG